MTQRYMLGRLLAKGLVMALLAAPLAYAAPAAVQKVSATVAAKKVMAPVKVDVAAARARVEAYLNGLTTLQAEFSQTVTGEAFGSEGTFYLKRPRQFLWQYETPVRQKVVSTGTAAYYVDQSTGKDGQVTQLPINAGLGRIFGTRSADLRKEGIEIVGATEDAQRLVVVMKLAKSKNDEDQAGIKQVTMSFDKGKGGALELRKIAALDVLQATTTVTFDKIVRGANLPAKLFAFTPGVYQEN